MRQIKTLDGIMSLDESNDVIGQSHHKEARNGVFKGNTPQMHFTAIRGNSTITNSNLIINDCKMAGSYIFYPNCSLVGSAILPTATPTITSTSTATSTPTTTTTSTSTPTVTVTPNSSFNLGYSSISGILSCSAAQTVYYALPNAVLEVGTQLYSDASLGAGFLVPNGYYADANNYYHVYPSNGQIHDIGFCPTFTPTATSTPTPTIGCFLLMVNVSSVDRAASDDGYVYFDYNYCGSLALSTIGYNVNKTNFNTGVCYDMAYGVPIAYYYISAVKTTAPNSSAYMGVSCIVTPSPTSTSTPTVTSTSTSTPTVTPSVTPTSTLTSTPTYTIPGFTITSECSGQFKGYVYISNFINGNGNYTSAKIGNTQANAASATAVSLVGLSNYQWNNLDQGTWYVILYDSSAGNNLLSTSFICVTPTPTVTGTATSTGTVTPSITPTSTATSTPTYTIPGFTITSACSGGFKGYVYISNFINGNGNYTSAKIGNTQANAASATPVSLVGLSNYQWSNLDQGPWYVILYDSTGGNNLLSTSFICNTPTATSTATSTPTITSTVINYTVSVTAHRNGIAGDTTFLYYSTDGVNFIQIPSNIARGASCIAYTSISVASGTTITFIQRNENVGAYVPAAASLSSCPANFTGELCANSFTIGANTTVYLYADTVNTTFGC